MNTAVLKEPAASILSEGDNSLKTGAAGSSETPVTIYQTAQRHNLFCPGNCICDTAIAFLPEF
jgi:hypothetical protein